MLILYMSRTLTFSLAPHRNKVTLLSYHQLKVAVVVWNFGLDQCTSHGQGYIWLHCILIWILNKHCIWLLNWNIYIYGYISRAHYRQWLFTRHFFVFLATSEIIIIVQWYRNSDPWIKLNWIVAANNLIFMLNGNLFYCMRLNFPIFLMQTALHIIYPKSMK